MKPILLLFALALGTMRAAEVPLPEFNSGPIGHPPVSLSELGKGNIQPMPFGQPLPSVIDPNAGARFAPAQPRLQRKSSPGQMPILEPNPSMDYKILLKEPAPTIDPKMLIPPPDLRRK